MPDVPHTMSHPVPKIRAHGGASGVTGSCHRFHLAPDRAVLVDCGLFQGQDAEALDSLADMSVHRRSDSHPLVGRA